MNKRSTVLLLLVALTLLPGRATKAAGARAAEVGAMADGSPARVAVVINEVLASNQLFADPEGELDDWLELYNPGGTAVDVGGLYLTDDPSAPPKWQIPAGRAAETTIGPQGYLLIWADKDTADPGLHAGFGLDAGGEELALLDADGATVIDSVSFGAQRAGVSYGRFPDGADTWSLLDVPTPAGANIRIHEGYLEAPQIRPGHGFYDSPVVVTITCTVPSTVIYYTLDGSEPYLSSPARPNATASVYSGPLQIGKTTCLRAAAARIGWKASPIATQTYIFVADVVKQSADGRSDNECDAENRAD